MKEKTFKLPVEKAQAMRNGFPLRSVLLSDEIFQKWLEEEGSIYLHGLTGWCDNNYLYVTITYEKPIDKTKK